MRVISRSNDGRQGALCAALGSPAAFEQLEPRQMLSAVVPRVGRLASPTAHPVMTAAKKSRSQTLLIAFYGLGGTGFPNAWLGTIADDAGAAGGDVVRKYQETDEEKALRDALKSMDADGNHTIDASEIARTTLRVVGYSFGAVAASNLTRDLTRVRKPVDGYKLSAAVPVKTLVTIDPVNYTGLRHTDGPVSNVDQFVSYYQLNPGGSSIALTSRSTGQSAGTAPFSDGLLPVGGTLSSAAQHSTQNLVDFGSLADHVITHRYSKSLNGTMAGVDVNHSTMPWYCYSFAIRDLTS